MKLSTDDAIHRYQGSWIDNRGSEMKIIRTYSWWSGFALSFLPLFVAARIVGLSLIFSIAVTCAAAAGVGHVVDRLLDGEYTVTSWVGVVAGWWRAAARSRQIRVEERRATSRRVL